MPVHHVDGRGPGLGEQRRPLERALAPAHQQVPAPRGAVQVDGVARVPPPAGRQQRRQLGRLPSVRTHAQRQDDPAGPQGAPVVERRHEPVVVPVEALDVRRERHDALLLHEPGAVVEVELAGERLRLRGGQVAQGEVGLDGRHALDVEVPVGGRAEQHPRGHVLLPERHRPTHHDVVDALPVGRGRQGQPERPGAHDQELGALHAPSQMWLVPRRPAYTSATARHQTRPGHADGSSRGHDRRVSPRGAPSGHPACWPPAPG